MSGADGVYWLAAIGIGLSGLVTRCSILLFGERIRLPVAVERALRHAPAAALAATIAPTLWPVGQALTWHPPRLVAALVAGVLMARTRNMLLVIVVGMVVFLLLGQLA